MDTFLVGFAVGTFIGACITLYSVWDAKKKSDQELAQYKLHMYYKYKKALDRGYITVKKEDIDKWADTK